MAEGYKIGNGRPLPPLLFLTNTEVLSARVSADECAFAVRAMEAAGGVLDVHTRDVEAIVSAVSTRLESAPQYQGIVIVGGHEVVPHALVDVVAGTSYESIAEDEDDEFVVWSDDAYGFCGAARAEQGDIVLPDVAVSRIPDTALPASLTTALQAAGGDYRRATTAVRNIRRPYAQKVYQSVFGTWIHPWPRVETSEPVSLQKPPEMSARLLYLVLHGGANDSALYGQQKKGGKQIAVIDSASAPENVPDVTFAAACWAALDVDTPASLAYIDEDVRQKTIAESLALTFLSRGARAFIGPTSVHYSPGAAAVDFAAAPLHVAFLKCFKAGISPARALLEAKRAYAAGMPYRRDDAFEQAIERKTVAEFCCLGLGW